MDGYVAVQTWLEDSLRHFKNLLRFDTTNPPGRKVEAVRYLSNVLGRDGIEHEVIERSPGRSNVVARLRGCGRGGALLMNGHLDVVPATREHWPFDPFGAVEADGCTWGVAPVT